MKMDVKMMKRLKKLVLTSVLAICMMIATAVTAFAHREVKTYNVSVSGHRAEDTGRAIKYHNGKQDYGKFRIALDSSSVKGNITLKVRMENSDHASRGSGKVTEPNTATINNSGTKGYYYHLNLIRENILGGSTVVTGTWSPDQPH